MRFIFMQSIGIVKILYLYPIQDYNCTLGTLRQPEDSCFSGGSLF